MASAAEIAELRRLINEPEDTDPWTDQAVGFRLDANEGTILSLAATIWREKAATFAELVDIQEGASNRKLSQLYAQALRMADGFDLSSGSQSSQANRGTRTRQIERG